MPQKPKETIISNEFTAKKIGERISSIRIKRGLSQTELAKKIGITRNRLSHYETGRIHLNAELLALIAETLNSSSDRLLGLTKPDPFPDIIPTRIVKLVERSLKIDDPGRRMIYRFMRSVIETYEPTKPQKPKKEKVTVQPEKKKENPVIHQKYELPKRHTGDWKKDEIEVLEMFYPRCEDKNIIREQLPGRTWENCVRKAEELGIKRYVDDMAIYRKPKQKTIVPKAKLITMLRQDLTLEEIAMKFKTTQEVIRRNMWRYGL